MLTKQLTRRQRQVLSLLDSGVGRGAVASRLGISIATVEFHLNEAYRRLGVHTEREAIAKARELGSTEDRLARQTLVEQRSSHRVVIDGLLGEVHPGSKIESRRVVGELEIKQGDLLEISTEGITLNGELVREFDKNSSTYVPVRATKFVTLPHRKRGDYSNPLNHPGGRHFK